MSRSLIYDNANDLKLSAPVPLSLHPAAVYLHTLSPGSVITMKQSLNVMARLLTEGDCDAMTLDWAKLRYHHTATIRRELKQRYSATTTNKMLCALRQVLQEALRLDLMEAADYAKAVDLPSVKGKKRLRGRALTSDEIEALMSVCVNDKSVSGIIEVKYSPDISQTLSEKASKVIVSFGKTVFSKGQRISKTRII